MEINPTAVNEAQAGAESPQEVTTALATEQAIEAAPAAQPVKPVQTPAENRAFAEMRRKAEAAEKAAAEAQRNLERITQHAYQRAPKEVLSELDAYEFQQQFSSDPSTAIESRVKAALDTHPDILAAREYTYRTALERDAALMAKDIPEAGITTPDQLEALLASDADMTELVQRGLSPVKAYRAAHFDEIMKAREAKAQNDLMAKVKATQTATPGALAQGATTPLSLTPEQLKHLDPARLRSDPEYYRAATEANRARFKK